MLKFTVKCCWIQLFAEDIFLVKSCKVFLLFLNDRTNKSENKQNNSEIRSNRAEAFRA